MDQNEVTSSSRLQVGSLEFELAADGSSLTPLWKPGSNRAFVPIPLSADDDPQRVAARWARDHLSSDEERSLEDLR